MDELSMLDETVSPKARLTGIRKTGFACGVRLFSGATVEQLFWLVAIAHNVECARQEMNCREGELADEFYSIVEDEIESRPEESALLVCLATVAGSFPDSP